MKEFIKNLDNLSSEAKIQLLQDILRNYRTIEQSERALLVNKYI
jgi:hypothetical protein